jgi:hypothetical protein
VTAKGRFETLSRLSGRPAWHPERHCEETSRSFQPSTIVSQRGALANQRGCLPLRRAPAPEAVVSFIKVTGLTIFFLRGLPLADLFC